MKILQIAPYTTCNDVPLLSQCKSGFGYMTYDIAHALAKEAEVDELLYNYRYNEFEHGGIRFVANTVKLHLKEILKCSNPLMPLKLWWKYRMQLRTFVRLVYIWLISGHFYDVIKNGKYDIVHIHGCHIYDEILMDVCRRANQKYVVTLHGLDSFSDSVVLERAGKQYERDFLQRVANGEFPITVISTGIKRIIENTYKIKDIPNLFVVCNAFSFSDALGGAILDIRKKYGIPADAKLILYVGNLCRRKNQGQLIESFPLLPSQLAEETYVLFMGRRLEEDYSIDALSDGNEYKDHFVECGNIDKELMPTYYQQGNVVALLSVSEGFGLGLIEGMHYGLPCISFDDIDAFEDVYNSNAMVGVSEHDNNAVAKGLQVLLTNEWDKAKIIEASRKFEPEKMAESYLTCFNQITSGL